MKSSLRHLTVRTLGACALLATSGALSAQNVVWGPNGSGSPTGGPGLWNLTDLSWTADNGGTYEAWAADTQANAIFGGVGGTVNVGTGIQAGQLFFNSDGYVVQGGTIRLTGNNKSPAITVTGASDTVTINSAISIAGGIGNFYIKGNGTVNIGGNISYDDFGSLTIAGATARVLLATASLTPTFSYLQFSGEDYGQGGKGTFIVDNTGATSNKTLSFFYGLTTTSGESTVRSDRVANFNVALNLGGDYYRTQGSTANFVVNGGTNGTNNRITIGTSSGLISQGAFFNGSSFAWKNNGSFYVRGINYGTDSSTATYGGGAVMPGVNHVQITGNVTAQTSATLQTLKIAGAHNLAIVNGATVGVNGILKAGGGASTISGGAIRATTAEADLVVRADSVSDVLTIDSDITDNGGSAFTKAGAGTVYLNGNNSYTGPTYINDGVLSVSSIANNDVAQALGQGSLELSGGTLRYTGTGAESTDKNLTTRMSGGTLDITNADSVLTMTGQLAGNSVTSSDFLVKDGAGTMVLGGVDENSGFGITVKSGKLILDKTGDGGAHAALDLIVQNGATAQLAGANGNQLGNNGTVVVDGTLDFNGRSELISSLTGSGSITNSATGTTGLLSIDGSMEGKGSNFSGVISDGAGTMEVEYLGGHHIVSGNNTYTGLTKVGDFSRPTTLQIGDGGTTGAIAGDILLEYGYDSTIEFKRSNTYEYTGAIAGNGVTVNLTGTGTIIFSGANTYNGTTTVSSGTLLVNSTFYSSIVVESGAKFAGTGETQDVVLVKSGGQIGSDDSVGTFDFQWGLTLEDDVTLSYQLGTVSDMLRISGSMLDIAEGHTITLDIAAQAGFAAGSYVLIDFAGAPGSNLSLDNFVFGTTSAGYDYDLELTGTQLILVASAVPEPSTAAVFALGLILLFAFQWFRRVRL